MRLRRSDQYQPAYNLGTPEERFHRFYTVDDTTGCWLWTSHRHESGYGLFSISVDGRSVPTRAHRFAYELYKGPLLPGQQALHRCDTVLCVNPEHLWAGDHLENMLDMRQKGRSPNGVKLTPPDVVLIRRSFAEDPTSIHGLADRYGISSAAVWRAATRKTWRNVP